MTPDDVLAVLDRTPRTVGDVGCALVGDQPADGQAVGAFLAGHGISLSALQKLVDQLVNDARVVEVRGRQLWDLGLPTEGTKSGARYFLLPA